jgi:WD40 repeat protein
MLTANGYLFIVGAQSDGVIVRNSDGSAKTVIDEPTPFDIAASPDGTRVYVALTTSGAGIAAIDTTTLTEVARYATGNCTNTLAAQGHKLWFGYGCGGGHIGVLDLSKPHAQMTLDLARDFIYPPYLAASDALPGRLFAGEQYLYNGGLYAFDTSGTSLTQVARTEGSEITDLALTPDGRDLVTTSGANYHLRFSTSDLSPDGQYLTGFRPNAVATASDNVVAAGVDDNPAIFVFDGTGTELRTYDFQTMASAEMASTLADRGLAFGADGSTLYAVTSDLIRGVATLWVLPNSTATLPPSHLALAQPQAAVTGDLVTITGSLTGASGGIPNARLRVWGGPPGRQGWRTGVNTSATGDFSIPIISGAFAGTETYTVMYDGAADHAPSSTSVNVTVLPRPVMLSLSTGATTTYAYGATATVTAHLDGVADSRTLSIYAQPYGGTKTLLKSAVTDPARHLVTTYVMRTKTVFSVAFAGDARYAPASAQLSRTVHARIAEHASGYYATSGSYKLFHATSSAIVTAHVTPSKGGQCVRVRRQVYQLGIWKTVSATCYIADATSSVRASIHAVIGAHYRVRAEFAGDARNVATSGAWLYLRFTR